MWKDLGKALFHGGMGALQGHLMQGGQRSPDEEAQMCAAQGGRMRNGVCVSWETNSTIELPFMPSTASPAPRTLTDPTLGMPLTPPPTRRRGT
jgi:hypothetical protein